MTLLLPVADGIAAHVAAKLPQATILRYEDTPRDRLREVTFYCLPYMAEAASLPLISQMPLLAVVQSLSIGVDDVLTAVPSQAVLCNGRGLHHEEGAAELAVTLILACMRQLPVLLRQQACRTWRHLRTESLDGKRVLLVGYGPIGSAVERRLLPFGAQVSRVSRTARDGVAPLSRLAELAATADILLVCIALTTETRGLVDGSVLSALPAGALVVNVARGPVIDAAALTAELASGRIRAALDVTDVEPLPPSRPEWVLENVLITPHIGGDTVAFAERAAGFVAEQATLHMAGQPLRNVVR